MNLSNVQELKQSLRAASLITDSPAAIAPFSIGIGLTTTPHQYKLAIRLRHTVDYLRLLQPRIRRILDKADNEVDIRVMAPLRPLTRLSSKTVTTPRLAIGASVGHAIGTSGTLGFFAIRNSDQRRGFVSCNHVIAAFDSGGDGDAVLFPSVDDGGTTTNPLHIVGLLDGTYPRLYDTPPRPGDCAFAAFKESPKHDPATVPRGSLTTTPAQLVEELEVTKIGRSTAETFGKIIGFNFDDLPLEYGSDTYHFDDVIHVDPAGPRTFSDPGDSGALVYATHTFQPVGLLMRDSDAGGSTGLGEAWLSDFNAVLCALKVTMTVT